MPPRRAAKTIVTEPTHVAIVGSRTFGNGALIVKSVIALAARFGANVVIVSGGARGADTFAANAAKSQSLAFQEFPADWDKFGKSAGYKRNEQIIAAADILVAFFAPGTRSPGTTHSINLALKKGIPVHVYHEGRWTTK